MPPQQPNMKLTSSFHCPKINYKKNRKNSLKMNKKESMHRIKSNKEESERKTKFSKSGKEMKRVVEIKEGKESECTTGKISISRL